jgi:hypothetical protein
MYSLTQAQYNQLMNFSKQASQLNDEAKKVQQLLSSVTLTTVSADAKDDDKLFAELRIKPYKREIILEACVPLCKQWDRISSDNAVILMGTILTDTFGVYDKDTFNKMYHILQQSGAKIAGSAALACVTDMAFQPGDIDIFFSGDERGSKGLRDMLALLQGHPNFVSLKASNPSDDFSIDNKHIDDELCVYKVNLGLMDIIGTISFKTGRTIQLIQLQDTERTTIRSFIRHFDLSCCQVFFDGIDFYIRSVYRDLTFNKFMLVCKQTNVNTNEQLAKRINKYTSRGFKAFTYYPELHVGAARDAFRLDVKSTVFEEQMEILFKHQPSSEVGVMLVSCWHEQVRDSCLDVSKIANHVKHYFTKALKTILQNKTLGSSTLRSIFDLMFALQDIRWLLLVLSEEPCMLPFFTEENCKRASADGAFARDSLQLFKNKVAQATSKAKTQDTGLLNPLFWFAQDGDKPHKSLFASGLSGLALVLFYKDIGVCEKCDSAKTQFEQMPKNFPTVKFACCNIYRHKELVEESLQTAVKLNNVPLFILFVNGKATLLFHDNCTFTEMSQSLARFVLCIQANDNSMNDE